MIKEFYPTPISLLDKIMEGVKWQKITTILEPSAGKGDIVDYIMQKAKATYQYHLDIDCVEIEPELRSTLQGKGHRVVHDDFMTFHTFKKYDLILMNPPFSHGAAHLTKALDMQKDGGYIICILNAENIRNPYTNEQKVLVKRLNDLGADITYLSGEFASAERPTGVEIAVIKVYIPERSKVSFIYESLKQKAYAEYSYDDMTELAPDDFIDAIIQQYNMEMECGIRLIQEYKAMSPYILQSLDKDCSYNFPILELKIDNHDLSTNDYVRRVRAKYWNALFRNTKFTGQMTSNLSQQYYAKVEKLEDFDFSRYNILCIKEDMTRNLVKGIEDCIIELFDKLSYQYSYSDELQNNIHYYNGWKSNKAWYINKKVILPYMNAFNQYSGKFEPYHVSGQLMDIEKALNYLDGGLTECRDMEIWLNHAEKIGQTKKIKLKYFYVTFYKKGTCHIEFTNEELLKKLNIFGSQQKKWLPPGYGKKLYEDMQPEEQKVIDEFEGKDSYRQTINNAKYFIYDPATSIKLLETS